MSEVVVMREEDESLPSELPSVAGCQVLDIQPQDKLLFTLMAGIPYDVDIGGVRDEIEAFFKGPQKVIILPECLKLTVIRERPNA